MAILSDILCPVCRRTKTVCHSASTYPNICEECEAERANDMLAKHLEERSKLSVEDRLKRLETELYEIRQRSSPFDYNQPIG